MAISICIPSIRQPTTSQQQKKSQTPNFYLLGKDFVGESTSKEDMEILFKQLKRLTKVAPVYFVYGNHENKIKFTRNKLNHKITKKQHYHSKWSRSTIKQHNSNQQKRLHK